MRQYKSSATIFCALLHSLVYVELSVGLNSVFHNQTIIFLGQTLISQNEMFEMGFFSPGLSGNRFLGVWYRSTPDVIVWVGNRNNPVKNLQGLRLAIVGSGTLAIMNAGGIIWSANSSGFVSKPIVQLLDSGNLVVMDQSDHGSRQSYKWQSFDHPTDTLLPGKKIVNDVDAGVEKYLTSWKNSDDPSLGDSVLKISNKGLPELVVYKGTKKIFRSGPWNGLYFSGTAPFPTQFFDPGMVFRGERLLSLSMIYDGTTFGRLYIDKSGRVSLLGLNAQKDTWNVEHSSPRDPCQVYGKCGPFGICKTEAESTCECLKGFAPKIQKDNWDWSGGCTRITPLDCQSKDHGFQAIAGVKYPDMLQFWLDNKMSLEECRAACLRNCNCTAFASAYINNGGSGCLIWFGELIDIISVVGAHGKQKIYIRLPASEVDSGFDLEEVDYKNRSKLLFVLISVASGILVSCFINVGIHYMARRRRQGDKANEDLDAPQYNLSTIISSTNNFSRENLLGEGGFGPVYRGILSTQEQIAIKRLSKKSRQGLSEFKNEVTLIAKLQHRNLIRLFGYCTERDERILIYEFMHNKSLDSFIFDQNRSTILTWSKRYEIIKGIARGLLYLHHDSRLKVIHRDLKTSNILLDVSFCPKISDFGLARTFKEDQYAARTKRVVGTYGYMSPEYAITGNFSMKSDIFSLGVVLLEIISGKKNRASLNNSQFYYTILEHAWLLWKENQTLELMDECLNNACVETQVKRCVQIGLLCVQNHPTDRPDMISVYSMLSTDEGTLPEPKEPGYFIETSSSAKRNQTSSRSANSNNETMSISDVEAR